jgi:hypothetical protein
LSFFFKASNSSLVLGGVLLGDESCLTLLEVYTSPKETAFLPLGVVEIGDDKVFFIFNLLN